MPATSVFRWMNGAGWLVLSGGTGDDEIRALALARSSADGAVAYVSLLGDPASGESLLDDMEDLGAPSGYLVDLAAEDDATIVARIGEAGIVVIEGSLSAEASRSALLGAAVEGLQTAFRNGAVVLVEGLSSMAFGSWVVRDNGEIIEGLGWLEGALVAPRVTDIAVWAQSFLVAQSSAVAVGIGDGSALALGPEGQIETWGLGEVGVALGSNYLGVQGGQ